MSMYIYSREGEPGETESSCLGGKHLLLWGRGEKKLAMMWRRAAIQDLLPPVFHLRRSKSALAWFTDLIGARDFVYLPLTRRPEHASVPQCVISPAWKITGTPRRHPVTHSGFSELFESPRLTRRRLLFYAKWRDASC